MTTHEQLPMSKEANAAHDHFKRSPPRQTGPIRNEGPSQYSGFESGSRGAAGTAFDAVKGSVEYGVQTAYMVIEEYMRRGYEAASYFQQGSQPGSDWGDEMNQNQYGYNQGDWSTGQMGGGAAQMSQWMQLMQQGMSQWMQMLQMMQSLPLPQMQQMSVQMMEMMRFWMSSWYSMFPTAGMPPGYGYSAYPGMGMPGSGPGMSTGPWGMYGQPQSGAQYGGMTPGFGSQMTAEEMAAWDPGNAQPSMTMPPPPPPPPPMEPVTGIRVQVHSHQPTEVIPSLNPGADNTGLVVDALAAGGQDAPPILGAIIQTDAGGHHVAVSVPPDQPVGRYSGAVRNSAGDYVGGLTVVVLPIASAI